MSWLMEFVILVGMGCLIWLFWGAMIEAQEQAAKENENRRRWKR